MRRHFRSQHNGLHRDRFKITTRSVGYFDWYFRRSNHFDEWQQINRVVRVRHDNLLRANGPFLKLTGHEPRCRGSNNCIRVTGLLNGRQNGVLYLDALRCRFLNVSRARNRIRRRCRNGQTALLRHYIAQRRHGFATALDYRMEYPLGISTGIEETNIPAI